MGGRPAQTIAALSVGGAEGRDTLPTTAPRSTNVSYVMVMGIPNMIAIAHTSTVNETESVGYQMTMHESPTNHIMPTYAHLDVKKDINKGVMSWETSQHMTTRGDSPSSFPWLDMTWCYSLWLVTIMTHLDSTIYMTHLFDSWTLTWSDLLPFIYKTVKL